MKYIDIELDGKQVRIPEFAYEESIQQISKILKEQLRVAAGDSKLISKILKETKVYFTRNYLKHY